MIGNGIRDQLDCLEEYAKMSLSGIENRQRSAELAVLNQGHDFNWIRQSMGSDSNIKPSGQVGRIQDSGVNDLRPGVAIAFHYFLPWKQVDLAGRV